MHDADIAALLLRGVLGVTLVMHGWNHGWGPGGVDGTARWFGSVGLRPAKLHAQTSVVLELAAGVALVAGLATPLAVACGIGVMTTAGITVHRTNGFFVFREGYEYVLVIGVALVALGITGPGRLSADHLLGWTPHGMALGLGAAVAGVLGCLAMLAACWRPAPATD